MEGGRNEVVVTSSSSIVSDFAAFRSDCPLKKFAQPHSHLEWTYFQAGPGDATPLVFLHGTSSTAAAFFYQVQSLSRKGYYVISAQYPAFSSPEEWCKGFDRFLDAMKCRAAHIVGAGLGGFLAQHYAARYPARVRSLVLCNSFASTYAFAARAGTWSSLIPVMPSMFLRQAMQDTLPQGGFMEMSAKQAIDWVGQQMNDLSGEDLASRLSLNCTGSQVPSLQLENRQITILESNGETMVPDELRRQLRIQYGGASFAELKSRGDFPYLSRPEEVTLFIEVHMRRFGDFIGYPTGDTPAAGYLEELPSWEDPLALREEPERRQVWKNPFEDDDLL
ncbi:unnamed protein product [Effrenium voratum]|uniref:Maspardin n=1 Tax=Effrenium voratum TaxID=2562239 RepID=A0AA36ITR4_9DINO|nr:unnamed protein product [Effrenium voratum]CAJ1392735.1 unnamed protein product [Effrenium voratum]CAJ1429017.1 unnamed protein product [Effrenium voratum]